MNMGKKALMLGICGAALSAAVLLIEKMNREKKLEEALWEVDEEEDSEIEFTMSAGEIDEEGFDDEDLEGFEDFEEDDEEPEVVKVVLTGPRTARVRPTEEEERDRLRTQLENMIRF